GRVDFALLVDGLQAEREQGITIDVAYRYFATAARRFIIADTPGHEQYARKGVLVQSRRHTRILSMLGVRRIVLAVNKMDLVDYSRDTFTAIVADYESFAATCGRTGILSIPIS